MINMDVKFFLQYAYILKAELNYMDATRAAFQLRKSGNMLVNFTRWRNHNEPQPSRKSLLYVEEGSCKN